MSLDVAFENYCFPYYPMKTNGRLWSFLKFVCEEGVASVHPIQVQV
jgi:hypothetical protein